VFKRLIKRILALQLRIAPVRDYLRNELISGIPNHQMIRWAPPGHFYSPLPDLAFVESQRSRLYDRSPAPGSDGVDLRLDAQRKLHESLAVYLSEFDWPQSRTPERRYFTSNGYFGAADAATFVAMIRHFKPSRILEIGSGFSSALALDANDRYCDRRMSLSFIEPNPDRLLSTLRPGDRAECRILPMRVQDVADTEFKCLDEGDVLFIDSSHVAKIGSDVTHLLFKVLPQLKPGVLIHFHDIFFPFEYPLTWIRDGRAWNELYMLRAFLQYNTLFQIVYHAAMTQASGGVIAADASHDIITQSPSSLWLRRSLGSER